MESKHHQTMRNGARHTLRTLPNRRNTHTLLKVTCKFFYVNAMFVLFLQYQSRHLPATYSTFAASVCEKQGNAKKYLDKRHKQGTFGQLFSGITFILSCLVRT
ncbi:MAG: hypothetical protein L6Q97_15415, partial [Thermoanaerobaculia bacterium]|nr:hypothetical protein [Thermoanaerobaculia bacterium]